MTESFVVGTASETAFLLVALLAKDPKWEVRAAIADLLPVRACLHMLRRLVRCLAPW